jgi:hypothetical protein
MAFLPAQPYRLVIDTDTTRSNEKLPVSPQPGMSDLEYAMLMDAEAVQRDIEYLFGRFLYLLRRVPGDETNETAAVSLRQPLAEFRASLVKVSRWIENAKEPR